MNHSINFSELYVQIGHAIGKNLIETLALWQTRALKALTDGHGIYM